MLPMQLILQLYVQNLEKYIRGGWPTIAYRAGILEAKIVLPF